LVRADDLSSTLAELARVGQITSRQYEELAGYLMAERSGQVAVVYGKRPDLLSRRRQLAARVGVVRTGARSSSEVTVDLSAILTEGRALLTV
jgi:hypothetical protein